MYDNFFALRLSQLRQIKGCSARDLSLSLGQNSAYINHIENGRALPSMQSFFNICEYLAVTPVEFFDTENVCPEQTKELITALKKLDAKTLLHITEIIKKLAK